jgi:hypothetical protein
MTFRQLALSLSLPLSIACGGPSGSSDTTTIGEDDVDDDVDESGSDTSDSDTGDASVPECEALIDCVQVVSPEAISSTIAAYGPEGSCFDVPGITPEDCAAECAALRADLAMINPDVAECAALDCNDDVLGLEELCDSGPACSPTCTFSSSDIVCNLLNQTGCEPDQICWFDSALLDSVGCWNMVGTPGAVVGDPCVGPDGPCGGDFSICMDHAACGGSPCCMATCYLGATEADFGACPGGTECVAMSEAVGASAEGTESYGVCI